MTLEHLPGTDHDVPCDDCASRVPAVWRLTARIVYLHLCLRHLRQLQTAITEALRQETEEDP